MGIKQVDIVPLAPPTPLTPTGKSPLVKVIQVSRTDTVSAVKAVLPAQSSILTVLQLNAQVSNAATTAEVTLTVTNNSGTVATAAADVRSEVGPVFVPIPGLPNIEPLPLNGDLKISAAYAETGTASTAGGPWTFVVTYV